MTSVTIVTVSMHCVKGPSASTSVTTPMAEEGERAMATTPASMLDTCRRVRFMLASSPSPPSASGGDSAGSQNDVSSAWRVDTHARALIVKQAEMEDTNRALSRIASSSSSEPAANVMIANVDWCSKLSSRLAEALTSPMVLHRVPVTR